MTLAQSPSAGETHPLGVSSAGETAPWRQALVRSSQRGLGPAMERRIMRGRRPSKTRNQKMRVVVFRRDHFTCQVCGWQPNPVAKDYDGRFCPLGPAPEPQTPTEQRLQDYRLLTLGHIVAASEGGKFEESNLRAECTRCNYGGGNTIKAAHDRGLTVSGEPWEPPSAPWA